MDECSNIVYDDAGGNCEMGQSDSKGARKRSGTPSGRGAAMSFGFRRKTKGDKGEKGDKSRDQARSPEGMDRNGNGGSTEELCTSPIASGRSTPLARPRKETSGQPLRTNRFGFRQTAPKTARVADVNISAERLLANKEREIKNNNNFLNGPVASAVAAPRSASVGRYTLQTAQLPGPQQSHMRQLDKSAKQVANNSRKVYGSSDCSSREGSVTGDSGVGLGDGGQGWAPRASRRQHRRPRALEMVMQGGHGFQLRELQMDDLDIMDEAIVTDVDVIPLPKLPSKFSGRAREPSLPSRLPSQLQATSQMWEDRCKDFRGEEKGWRDGIQREKLLKQDSPPLAAPRPASRVNITACPIARETTGDRSSPGVQAGAGDSPGGRSGARESRLGPRPSNGVSPPSAASPGPTWGHHDAGEAMALRSNDDISIGLSLSSSCDDDKAAIKSAKELSSEECAESEATRDYAKLSSHPLMAKSFNLSQTSAIQSILLTSMSRSTYLADEVPPDDPQLALAALAASNQSLIDDETSPADSLLSSSSDSHEPPAPTRAWETQQDTTTASSSAYHTADLPDEAHIEDEKPEDNLASSSRRGGTSPEPPSASVGSRSLSLSEGRDFLIDDEIADQPALIFEAASTAEPVTSSLQLLHGGCGADSSRTLQDLPLSRPKVPSASAGGVSGHGTGSQQQLQAGSPPRPRRSPSLDTLSPCDSIASDDLIMDMDLHHSLTSLNSADEYIDRLDSSIRSGLNSLEDSQLREELMKLSVRRRGSSRVPPNEPPNRPLPPTSGGSGSPALGSLPARPLRLLSRSRAGTPESPALSRGRAEAPPPGGAVPPAEELQQDVAVIRAMLLKLKKVLQEAAEGRNVKRTDTLNPLEIQRDSSALRNNGPSHKLGEEGEASPPPPPPAPHEEAADLRRQLVYLQGQLEERERTVRRLQQQVQLQSQPEHQQQLHERGLAPDSASVATQTERLRPISQGPNIFQNFNSESHVNGLARAAVCGTVQWLDLLLAVLVLCSLNLLCLLSLLYHSASSFRDLDPCSSKIDKPHLREFPTPPAATADANVSDSRVAVKHSCRVGSRYLQAIAGSAQPPRAAPRFHSRSKSIDHSHGNSRETNETGQILNGHTSKLSLLRRQAHHHGSFTNIYRDRIEDRTTNIKNTNGYTNGIDIAKENGPKSLPPSALLTCVLPEMSSNSSSGSISSIPRRSMLRCPSDRLC